MRQLLNYINGELTPAASGATLDVIEPATGQPYATAPDSSADDVHAAVDAARRAFPAWSATPAPERSALMLKLADAIEVERDELAALESRDTGKPITLARTIDIPRAAANLRFFATAILHDFSEAHITDENTLNYTRRQPRGVAGLISPWNLPLYLFTWKIAPALATGNTCVGKPSEVTPATAARLGELAANIGFPPGVLNIVHGRGATVGAAIVEHPDVPTISFTGGTATGRAIASTAGPMFKRLSLELGGKNPNIIFADADFDQAVSTAVRAAFTNQGQICLCGSRIVVESSIADRFINALTEQTKALTVGDPELNDTRFGAVVSAEHLSKIEAAVQQARDDGAVVHCGGKRAAPPNERCANGCFYEPTVLSGLSRTCAAQQEEIFGPVVTIDTFDSEQDAIEAANSTRYGLASMLFTSNLDRAHRVANAIDAGIVWVNCWLVRDLRTPFGGMKQSGVGREGGRDALRFFTEAKNICIQTAADSTPPRT